MSYLPAPITVLIASLVNGRADSVTSAVSVMVIPLSESAEHQEYEAAEDSNQVRTTNAI